MKTEKFGRKKSVKTDTGVTNDQQTLKIMQTPCKFLISVNVTHATILQKNPTKSKNNEMTLQQQN